MARSRRTKHYLLDPRFQLKWTGYLVVVVLAVMASLGVLIARMASRTSETANIAVTQAEKAFKESKVNNQLARGAVELAAPDNATLAGVMNEQLREVDAEQEKNLAEVRRLQQDIGRDKQSLQLLLVGAGVAFTGIIAFVGLVIPHLVRIVTGPSHRVLIPASALGGALVVVLADLVARMAVENQEMPLGVLTALVGGPFFFWLVRRTRERAGGWA